MKMAQKVIALIAHDRLKNALADWVSGHEADLTGHRIVCTGTTGGRLKERCPGLTIELKKSGPLGGDQQIGSLIAEGKVDALIFFTDALSPHPHDVDVKALTRLATLYDIPMACNPSTASLIMASGYMSGQVAIKPAPDRSVL